MTCSTCKYKKVRPNNKPCLDCMFNATGRGKNKYVKAAEVIEVEYALKVLKQTLAGETFTASITPLEALDIVKKKALMNR